MQQREPHLTTAYIALICSALGWVSWGVIAIPGVIIAHTVKSHEPSTTIAIKAALRVGYTAILVGLAGFSALVMTYLGFVSRLKVALGLGDASHLVGSTTYATPISPEESYRIMANWGWIGGIVFVMMIVFVSMLPLLRKGYASLQAARILRSNSTR